MLHLRRIAGPLLALLLLGVLSACIPTPQAQTVDVVGDSITAQSHWNRDAAWRAAGVGLPADRDLVVDAWLGYRFEDVQARETARANDPDAPRPAVLVIALGTNNAADGWTAADETAFSALLATPHETACVVVSLPAVAPSASATTRARFSAMRPRMRAIAEARPRTVVVDWQPAVNAHPDYLDPDGIHLAHDQAAPGQSANADAADAFASNLWAGVAACP